VEEEEKRFNTEFSEEEHREGTPKIVERKLRLWFIHFMEASLEESIGEPED
jgi:hypothetical protein